MTGLLPDSALPGRPAHSGWTWNARIGAWQATVGGEVRTNWSAHDDPPRSAPRRPTD